MYNENCYQKNNKNFTLKARSLFSLENLSPQSIYWIGRGDWCMGFVLLVKSLRDKNYCIKLLKTLYVAAWQLVDTGNNVVSTND